jgi:cystinosin
MNCLGFIVYTISTAAFLWSPTVRAQYAQRHPASPETTVRFNDFAFAAHSAVLCILIYTQFYPSIWGFDVGRTQKASRVVLGIIWGSLLSIVIVGSIVWSKAASRERRQGSWEWLDLVCFESFTFCLEA